MTAETGIRTTEYLHTVTNPGHSSSGERTRRHPITTQEIHTIGQQLKELIMDVKPADDFRHSNPLVDSQRHGTPFPDAASRVEQVFGFKMLPQLTPEDADLLPNAYIGEPRISEETRLDPGERIDKLIAENAHAARVAAQGWRGPLVRTIEDDAIYDHLPFGRVRSSWCKEGERLLGERTAEDFPLYLTEERNYRKNDRGKARYYSREVMEAVLQVSGFGFEGQFVNPITGAVRGHHERRVRIEESTLRAPMADVIEGKKRKELSASEVTDIASNLLQRKLAQGPIGILEGDGFAKAYHRLTDAPLGSEGYDTFFTLYYDNWLGVHNASYGKGVHNAEKGEAGLLEAFLKRTKVEGTGGKFFRKLMRGTNGHAPTPEGLIQFCLTEVGVDTTDHAAVATLLEKTAADVQEWLGYAKYIDEQTQGRENPTNHFMDTLAFAVYRQVSDWKEAVTKKGWHLKKGDQEPEGTLQEVAAYFKAKPAEWMVRRYTSSGGGALIEGKPESRGFPSAEKVTELVGNAMVEEGFLPAGEEDFHQMLRQEIFPFQQLLLTVGATPEQVIHFFESRLKKVLYSHSTPLDRARAARQIIREYLEKIPPDFELRYQKQLIRDEEGAKVMLKSIESSQALERERTSLSAPTLIVGCGDGRNESYRVAIERRTTSDELETIGTAGNFGIPYPAIVEAQAFSDEGNEAIKKFYGWLAESGEDIPQEVVQNRIKTIVKESDGSPNWKSTLYQALVEAHHTFYKLSKNPLMLHANALGTGGLIAGYYALDLASFVLAPTLRRKLQEAAQKEERGRVKYDVNPAADPNLSEELRGELTRLERQFSGSSKTAKDIGVYHTGLEKVKLAYKADLVERFLTITGLDITKWNAKGKDRTLAIVGHEAHVHENNVMRMIYECGACGGNSGYKNARVMSEVINDSAVREILAARGIDLKEIKAINGIYDTTRSHTTWDYPAGEEERYADFDRVSKEADTEARRVHRRILLGRETLFSDRLPDRVRDRWIQMVTERRAASPYEAVPELGHRNYGGLIVGPREYLRGIRANEWTTTFSINPATEQNLVTQIVDIFSGVYAGIVEEYRSASENSTTRKAQANYIALHGTGNVLTLRSGTDLRPVGTLPMDVVEGRVRRISRTLFKEQHEPIHFTRPNIVVVAKRAYVEEALKNHEQFRLLVENDYANVTYIDPETGKAQMYESDARRKIRPVRERGEEGDKWRVINFKAHGQEQIQQVA